MRDTARFSLLHLLRFTLDATMDDDRGGSHRAFMSRGFTGGERLPDAASATYCAYG
jgi:hypothetical protein